MSPHLVNTTVVKAARKYPRGNALRGIVGQPKVAGSLARIDIVIRVAKVKSAAQLTQDRGGIKRKTAFQRAVITAAARIARCCAAGLIQLPVRDPSTSALSPEPPAGDSPYSWPFP